MTDIFKPLKAPFPWFGGKSRVAHIVWERFCQVKNYVEPFAGSLAVLLGNPAPGCIETVNDKDCYLANFWRALKHNPKAVAKYADWPVNEADLHARHKWLIDQKDFQAKMKTDPKFYDAKIAGWWVWGLCAWIGDGWCHAPQHIKRPAIQGTGRGLYRKQLPHLADGGRGVQRNSNTDILAYLSLLSTRIQRTRVCCGDWTRVVTKAVTYYHGLTAVFLDPPYDQSQRSSLAYREDTPDANAVRDWAVTNGDNPLLRIALCGYAEEHDMPSSWQCVAWKAQGGYGVQGNKKGRANRHRERIWFSPHCLSPTTSTPSTRSTKSPKQ